MPSFQELLKGSHSILTRGILKVFQIWANLNGSLGAGSWLAGSPVQECQMKGFSASGSNPKGVPKNQSWCIDTRERLVEAVGFAETKPLPFLASATWPENRASTER